MKGAWNDALDQLRGKWQEAERRISDAWAALGTTAEDAADDPATAELADSIRVSLQYERDQHNESRASLDRVEHERDAMREEVARLSDDHASTVHDYLDRSFDKSDRGTGIALRIEGYGAKLGRAVAALRKHRATIAGVTRFVRDMGDMPNAVAAVQDFLTTVDAILADPDSAAAGDYVRELEAVYEAAKYVQTRRIEHGRDAYAENALFDALTRLEIAKSRRGGGKDGADFPPLGDCPRCGKPWRTWGTDAEPIAEVICDSGHSAPHPWGRAAAEAHARKGGK
jgi:hypothetical protein